MLRTNEVFMTKEELKQAEADDLAQRQSKAAKTAEKLVKREQRILAEREDKKERLSKILKVDRKNIDELLNILRSIW
jgi:hypothetical protein